MLLRKRAWDVMRSEFQTVPEDASLSEAINALNVCLDKAADCDCLVVVSPRGRYKGMLTIRSILKALGPCLLKELKKRGDEDWEKSFDLAVTSCSQAEIADYVQKGIPTVNPRETLGRVLEVLNDYRTERVVVEEGDKVIGVIQHADVFREICREE